MIILASHYDSKYFEEFRFVGANDGGSSSAILLELARILSGRNPTGYSVWFVFFDGEEALQEWTDLDSLYGSRQFVRMLQTRQQLREVAALILLDLVGEEDLVFRKDVNSSPWLVDIIWKCATEMGHGAKFSDGYVAAIDDHIPFSQAGIPVVDLIDLDYAYWHTKDDTIDKLSSVNMRIVAEIVLTALPKIAQELRGRH